MIRPTRIDSPLPEDFVPPQFFVSTTPSSWIAYASPSIAAVVGLDPVKLIGRNFLDFFDQTHTFNQDIGESLKWPDHVEAMKAIRVMKSAQGTRRVLFVQTTRTQSEFDGDEQRLHHIFCDITAEYTFQSEVLNRFTRLDRDLAKLTPLEREVADSVTRGQINREIANRLKVSTRTVERGRSAIQKRFGVESSSEVVAIVSQHRMLRDLASSREKPAWHAAYNLPAQWRDQPKSPEANQGESPESDPQREPMQRSSNGASDGSYPRIA